MNRLITNAGYALIAIALAPLLALGLYLLANALGFSNVANRMPDTIFSIFMLQSYTGGIANLLGELPLCVLSTWCFMHMTGIETLLAICALWTLAKQARPCAAAKPAPAS